MKRRIACLLLLAASAMLGAEVNFQYFPVGCTPPLSSYFGGQFCTGQAGVLVLFSATPGTVVDTYTATVSFTLNGHSGTATQTIESTDIVDGNRVSLMPYLVSDVPNVVITQIAVTANLGQVETGKTVKLPVPAATY